MGWTSDRFLSARVGIAGILSLAIVVCLGASTWSYTVYMNDFPMFLHGAVFLLFFVLCLLIVTLGPRRVWTWLFVLGLICGSVYWRHWMIKIKLQNCISSCANHSSFWDPRDFASETPLTNSVEFQDFLIQMHGKNNVGASLYCPGSSRAGSKTGVVFVGGGLRLDSLREDLVLIAFCSWKSHPPPFDHQHYLMWRWYEGDNNQHGFFDRECADTDHIMLRIRTALEQAKAGKVPYSPDAVKILNYELAERQKLAKDIKITDAKKLEKAQKELSLLSSKLEFLHAMYNLCSYGRLLILARSGATNEIVKELEFLTDDSLYLASLNTNNIAAMRMNPDMPLDELKKDRTQYPRQTTRASEVRIKTVLDMLVEERNKQASVGYSSTHGVGSKP